MDMSISPLPLAPIVCRLVFYSLRNNCQTQAVPEANRQAGD